MNKKNPPENTSVIQNAHSRELEDILTEMGTDPSQGLSRQEAQDRLKAHGPNQLKEHEEKGLAQIFIDQTANPIVYLLGAAAVLAFVFGDLPEGIAILVVLVLNTIIGFWMEFQARQSMNALQKMDKVV